MSIFENKRNFNRIFIDLNRNIERILLLNPRIVRRRVINHYLTQIQVVKSSRIMSTEFHRPIYNILLFVIRILDIYFKDSLYSTIVGSYRDRYLGRIQGVLRDASLSYIIEVMNEINDELKKKVVELKSVFFDNSNIPYGERVGSKNGNLPVAQTLAIKSASYRIVNSPENTKIPYATFKYKSPNKISPNKSMKSRGTRF